MSCGGWPIGMPSPVAPVIEEQWPALTTIVGVTSVPEHRKASSIVISATKGYLPAGTSVPPTTAWADETGTALMAIVARRVRRRIRLPTNESPGSCDRNNPGSGSSQQVDDALSARLDRPSAPR